MDESDWSSHYELTFSLWLERAECDLLAGDFGASGQLIEQLLPRAASRVDEAAVYYLKVQLHIITSDYPQAVATGLACLRPLGVDMPAHPTQEQVQAEYETVWKTLNGRPIESLIDLPLMTDPELLAAMRLMSGLVAPSYHFDHRLWCLQVCRMVQISVRNGTSGPSTHSYAHFGVMLGGVFHRIPRGLSFRQACLRPDREGRLCRGAGSSLLRDRNDRRLDAADHRRDRFHPKSHSDSN